MANFTRNFIAGRMNKTFDERVIPDGEYIDAMNIRMGSTEKSEAGVIENTKGNLPLTTLTYIEGTPLSNSARCIGAIDDSANETLYWFVHDPDFGKSPTGKLDLIVSYNTTSQVLTYHVVSVNDGTNVNTTLNFNPQYLITGVNLIENLLFFTDDYNQPRFINVTRNYDNPDVTFVDNNGLPDLLAEALLVIKKPPTESPTITLLTTSGQENFLEDRFICFAYRYKYADGEYSAISQWTEPAFVPNSFVFDSSTFLNEGMINEYNAVNVYYNSGGPLVIGIDLLFKEATSNVIKVIEKINKQTSAVLDNTIQVYFFNNSKIFTILPESELLRLYDNVPRLSKAQTIMGNRLMYGNYVDGYDLIDKNGNPTLLEYTVELNSEELNNIELPTSKGSTVYSFDILHVVNDSALIVDLTGINLIEGSLISFSITITHDSFTGSTPFPTQTTSNITINFSINLQNNYSSVYSFATSTEFQQAIGTSLPGGNIQLVYNPSGNSSCDGVTFTDRYNCSLPYSLDALAKYDSGITTGGEAILITTSPSSNNIRFDLLAMKYIDNPISTTKTVYEYYKIINSNSRYVGVGTTKSLHSNRGYEIGIVYMDEFNRATPAFCSPINTAFVPCGYSKYLNSITVTIPPNQIAPYWADRYKFVCKADQEGYETIYSNIFFDDIATNSVYFLLEGENARKVEQGDRLIVKADTDGPTTSCKYATVLEKEAKQKEFIITVDGVKPPAGVYMKINASDFSVTKDSNSTILPGTLTQRVGGLNCTRINYPMNIPGTDPLHPTWTYVDYTVPAGSVIRIYVKVEIKGDFWTSCEKRLYELDKTYISQGNYDNMYDWFTGDNVDGTIDNGNHSAGTINNNFNPSTVGNITNPCSVTEVYWKFVRDSVTNRLILQIQGIQSCTTYNGPNIDSNLTVDVQVSRAIDLIIFETEPLDTLPDVFFENELSFPIDNNGNHLSNGVQGDVSQDISLGISAEIQTGFFNCFTFGNGAESYKIRDSIIGRDFNLGNRVTTVAAQDYGEERRFADITYSGVYNPETNVNKLNEFNYALLNYKNLELSFGAVYILDGRETDVLVLQEDKVSYVLAGKNLLSDAAAGGAITSVPEVLGTQIARTEKYGISFNPESYVQWGYDRFFTDAKRGAVLQLKGNAYSNEQLTVISEQNMRTWFRDTFISSFNTQKLGGFDPYMNEYVLSINDIQLPEDKECIKCGTTQTLTFAQGEGINVKYNFCSEFGNALGEVIVEWNVMSIDPTTEFEVDAVYDGIIYPSGVQTSSGSIDFFKLVSTPTSAEIQLSVTGNVVLMITVRCPEQEPMTLVEVVLTLDSDSGKTMLNQFNYVNGVYTSPTQNRAYIFGSGTGNPLVTLYNVTNGFVGQGNLPPEGATMRLQTNETQPWVTFDFDPAFNKFKYARTSVLYGNNNVDMQTLLSISSDATPIVNPSTGIHYADFTVPLSVNGKFLYIIWDLRKSTEVQMCYGATLDDVCCDCEPCLELCSYYIFSNPASATVDAIVEYPLGTCFDPTVFTQTILPGESFGFCLPNDTNKYTVLQGNPAVYMDSCFCGV